MLLQASLSISHQGLACLHGRIVERTRHVWSRLHHWPGCTYTNRKDCEVGNVTFIFISLWQQPDVQWSDDHIDHTHSSCIIWMNEPSRTYCTCPTYLARWMMWITNYQIDRWKGRARSSMRSNTQTSMCDFLIRCHGNFQLGEEETSCSRQRKKK